MDNAVELADGRQRRAREGFKVKIAGADLKFEEHTISDPVPTGRQIAESFAHYDPEEAIVLQWLPNGMLEELRMDEATDLRETGVERFVVVRNDRAFRLEIAGKRQEWPAAVITAATIKALAGVESPDNLEVVLLRENEPDLELVDEDTIDLSATGLERFDVRAREREVEIFVNERLVRVERGDRTGLEIKTAAMQQSVPIQADFLLTLEKPNGQSKMIGDNDVVKVRKGLRFTAIADDDNS